MESSTQEKYITKQSYRMQEQVPWCLLGGEPSETSDDHFDHFRSMWNGDSTALAFSFKRLGL